MDAQTADFLGKAFYILGLVILAAREIIRTRKERAERHDSGRLERFRAEAEEAKRRDDLLSLTLEQLGAQRQETASLTSRIGQFAESNMQLAQSINKNTQLEIDRIQANERIHQAHNQSIIENVRALGDNSDRLRSLDKGITQLDEKVKNFPIQMTDEHGRQQSAILGKITTEVGRVDSMLNDQFDPVNAALKELDTKLKEIQERVNEIPDLRNQVQQATACLIQATTALQSLTESNARMAVERDSALNELDKQTEMVVNLRNTLVQIDQQNKAATLKDAHDLHLTAEAERRAEVESDPNPTPTVKPPFVTDAVPLAERGSEAGA